MPYEILQFVQDAADQQAALAQLLCSYGMAYEMMDGGICMAPFYQGMDLSEIFNQLKKRLRHEKGKTTVGAEHNTQIQTPKTNYEMSNITITNNFYAPIGQQISHVDQINAHFDRDMQMQVTHADQIIQPVTPVLPHEGDYKGLAQWICQEKERGKDWYAEALCNRSQMCRDLTNLLGWVVDPNSLRKYQL